MGYEAHSIEDIDGLFAMYRKDTNELFYDYDNADPEKVKNAAWLCDVDKLKELLSQQTNDLAFYCGIASNIDEITPQVIVLQASPEVLHERLSHREGTEDMGGTEQNRQTVLGWKDWWEEKMAGKGAILLSADSNPETISAEIIQLTRASRREDTEFTKSG